MSRAAGRPGAAVFLLVLASLAVLGRNAVFDSLFEATYVDGEVIRTYFREFVTIVGRRWPPELPSTD